MTKEKNLIKLKSLNVYIILVKEARYKMNALGRHILAEIYGCDSNILDNLELIEDIMVQSAIVTGAEIREVAFHKFNPQGVSGVVVISESHITIHTWPELGYAAVDVFTCGDDVNPWDACNYIAKMLRAQNMTATEVKRGVFEKPVKVVNY